MFFLFAVVIYPLFMFLLGFGFGILMKFTGGWRHTLLIFLVPSLLPWLLHLFYAKDINEVWPSAPHVDPTSFIITSTLLAGVLLLASLFATWRVPLLAPLLPLVLGFLYFEIPLEQFSQELVRHEILFDNTAHVTLFWTSSTASAALFGYALTRYLEPHTLKYYLKLR